MPRVMVLVAAVAALAAPNGDAGTASMADPAPSAEPAAKPAFLLALGGDLDDADREAEKVLATSPDDAVAILVLACVALEKGDLAGASQRAARLEQVGSTRGPVMRRLVERRRELPSEPMRVALAEAWKEAGRPGIGRDVSVDLLDFVRLVPPVPSAAWAKLSDVERAALAEGGLRSVPGSSPREDALAAAAVPERNPFWVNALLVKELSAPWVDPPELKHRAAAAERRLAAALAAADPGNGYHAMITTVADGLPKSVYEGKGGAPPLGDAELGALEAAAAAPRFEWPARRLRTEVAARLRAIDPVHGELRAARAGWSTFPIHAVPLGVRAHATPPPGSRARTARVLAAVGRRLGAGPLAMDRRARSAVRARLAAGTSSDRECASSARCGPAGAHPGRAAFTRLQPEMSSSAPSVPRPP